MADKPPSETPRIDRVRLRDDPEKEQIVIEIDLFNPLERTVHVHATPRKANYDPATGRLVVELSDENLSLDLPTKSLRRPKFKAIDPQRKSTMRVRLPRITHQLSSEASEGVPVIETQRLHEASDIEVMLAWSDTPFYPDPREGAETRFDDVVAWQKGTLHGRSGGRA